MVRRSRNSSGSAASSGSWLSEQFDRVIPDQAVRRRAKAVKAELKAATAQSKAAKRASGAAATAASAAGTARKQAKSALNVAESATVEAKAATAAATAALANVTQARKAAEAEQKAAKKAAAELAKTTRFHRWTDPKRTKRLLAVAGVLLPAAAPFALKAATAARGWVDTQRSHRLGVTAAEVGAYRGPTGSAQARIGNLRSSLADLRARRGSELEVTRFVEVASGRLDNLAAATTAAATMPSSVRRSTIAAINADLTSIHKDLMSLLVGQ